MFKSNFYYNEYSFKNIKILIYSKSSINWKNVLYNLQKIEKYLKNINFIYFGKFQNLKNNNNVSEYKNNSIIISNQINDDINFLKCIIHECIHSFVDVFEKINFFEHAKKEYLEKKKIVLNKLHDPDNDHFVNFVYYNKQFDEYLMNIGYNKLQTLIKGKFPTPYSMTSFIEYVAICAEEFFFDDGLTIEKLCPFTIKFLKSF